MSDQVELELLLRQALAPVEPPADLAQRLETTLVNLTELMHEELEGWELEAMRDPRNWVRPAVAVAAGGVAGAGLVVLRARRKASRRAEHESDPVKLAQKFARDLVREARTVIDPSR